uniref:Uncharacterized protein n=1 Tax=Micrurus lemniscatus lemniscatus TaxID=129467 RepID=A0A2D4J4A1_MICLE
MLTSLAPSPIANVIGFSGDVFSSRTTFAFCRGAMRQHSTAEQFRQTSMKSFSCCLRARERLVPSTTSPCWITWSSFILLASCLNCSAHVLSDLCCTSSRMFMVLWKCPHDKLTLTAVSCLSPVSTHTLIPANRRASMVSWTLSCSLSSTPVAPSNSKSFSIKLYASANRSSRCCKAVFASKRRCSTSLYSSSVNFLYATQRVLSPFNANSSTWSLVFSTSPFLLVGRITDSAPLVNKSFSPDGVSTITLILLRLASKSSICSNLYLSGFPPLLSCMLSAFAPVNTTPALRAASTKAFSSGDEA